MADQLDYTADAAGTPRDLQAAYDGLTGWCEQRADELTVNDVDGAARIRALPRQVFDTLLNQHTIPTLPRLYPLLAEAVAQLGHAWDDTTGTVQPLTAPPTAAVGDPADPGQGEYGWFLTGDELAATRHKLAQISRRATAKGFTGQLDITAEPAARTWTPAPGAPPVTVHGFEVTITGQPPSYEGWRFLAAVDNVAGQPILRYPPGTEEADQVPNDEVRPGVCDHCHTVRDRTRTLLVRHDDTGELKQVGSTCLKDFLGWQAMPVFLDTDTVRDQLERGAGRSQTGPWELTGVLAYSWAIIAEHGWVPASAGLHRTPTRDLVTTVLLNQRGATDILHSIRPRLPDAAAMAARIISDLTDQLAGETSGYGGNLKALLAAGIVPVKQLGLAVSAVHAWERSTTPQAAAEPAAPRVLHHAGTVGEKITVTGTVTTLAHLPGYQWNSPTQRLIVIDCGDAIAKTITTAGWSTSVGRGDTVTLTGTVKAHDHYRDVPQTVLTRCTLTDHTPAAATPAQPIDPALPADAAVTRSPAPLAVVEAPIITPEYSATQDGAAEGEVEPVTPRWETVTSGPPQSRFREDALAAVQAPHTALTLF